MLQYNMDIDARSYTQTLTPDAYQQKLPFYAYVCGYFDAGPDYYTLRDGMRNYLMLITVEGCGTMTWKNETLLLEAGSAVLIDCEQYHEYRTHAPGRWKFYFVHMGGPAMAGFQSLLFSRLTCVMLRAPEYAFDRMKEFFRLSRQTDAAASVVRSHLLSGLLTEMVCSLAYGTSESPPLNRNDISELALYIQNNYHQDLHLEDFMRHTHLSRHYLIHVFQRQMGMAPYRYLHMCRINRAQILLQNTDLSVSRIGSDIGYQTLAAFLRQFRSFTGTTPGEYRRTTLLTAHIPK